MFGTGGASPAPLVCGTGGVGLAVPRKRGSGIAKWQRKANDEWEAACKAQEVITICALCDWRYHGPMGEGQVLFAQHRKEEHGQVRRVHLRLVR